MFIAAIGIATGLLFGIKNFSDSAESNFVVKKNDFDNKILTALQIEMLHFDNMTNVTSIYIKNTGRTMLDPTRMDVYIDGVRIPRNDTERTISVLPDTDTINSGILDPKETAQIMVFGYLDETMTHEVTVTTQYETKDSEVFSP
jgi:archaellum component FlaG (FlaF/FlaG flagellin family)